MLYFRNGFATPASPSTRLPCAPPPNAVVRAMSSGLRPSARLNGAILSHDPRRLVAPVTIAQQPLVELAGRQPRQLIFEIDGARHLRARQRLAAEQHQLVGKLRPRQPPRPRGPRCFPYH